MLISIVLYLFYLNESICRCNLGTLWLKHIMNAHAGILLANPELSDIIGPALSAIQNRLTLFNPLNSLKGRLDLLVTQLSVDVKKDIEDEPFLIFNDKGKCFYLHLFCAKIDLRTSFFLCR